nr:MAG TPA: hypothetical protein [Caudoviricetes sp.]
MISKNTVAQYKSRTLLLSTNGPVESSRFVVRIGGSFTL